MLNSLSANCSIHDNMISILSLNCDLTYEEIEYTYEPSNLYTYLYSNLLGRYQNDICKFILFLPSITLGITSLCSLTMDEYIQVSRELHGILDKVPRRQYAFAEDVFDITDYNLSLTTPTGLVVMNDNNFEVFAQTPLSFAEYTQNYLERYLGTKYTALQIEDSPNYSSYFIYKGAKRRGVLYFECMLSDVDNYIHVKYKEVLYGKVSQ